VHCAHYNSSYINRKEYYALTGKGTLVSTVNKKSSVQCRVEKGKLSPTMCFEGVGFHRALLQYFTMGPKAFYSLSMAKIYKVCPKMTKTWTNVECISSIHFSLFGQSDEKRKNQLHVCLLFFNSSKHRYFLLTNKEFTFSVKSKYRGQLFFFVFCHFD
jgi:hypothetical protein